MKAKLTDEEKVAIAGLRKLAKNWPDSLWLFSASGTLCVMRNGDDGKPVRRKGANDAYDPSYIVATVEGLPNDGGDW